MLLFFSLGYFIDKKFNTDCVGNYKFINKHTPCFNAQVVGKQEYTSLRSEIYAYIENEKKTNDSVLVSVFFRDLNTGPTFGINENADFIPASLLKLPNVLALFSFNEENPSANVFDRSIMITGDPLENTQEFKPEMKLEKNKEYLVSEIVKYSLAYSDNLADNALRNYLKILSADTDILTQTYRELGIVDANASIEKEIVTPKTYASMFRLLYNSSFLNSENSEKVLSALSQSTFNDGLRQGVPSDIVIAHKFAERILEGNEKQLHDCGIVYYPKNPYLICVMVKGGDFTKMTNIISHISGAVFEEFDSRKIN